LFLFLGRGKMAPVLFRGPLKRRCAGGVHPY
jgi:hypothetical protein